MVQITYPMKQALLERGVSTLHNPIFNLPDKSIFEPPCSFKWMNIDYAINMGAFSYAVSGYYFGVNIGRYTSIGENVQIGRGSHPTTWATTSPILYQDHQSVVNFDIPQASSFRPNADYVPPATTHIGNDVYIGHGAFICQGVRIGDGAIIGAQSVVTRDVPPYSIVAGSPARVKKMRFNDNLIEQYLDKKWWEFAFWDLNNIPIVDPEVFIHSIAVIREEGKISTYKPPLVSIEELFLNKEDL